MNPDSEIYHEMIMLEQHMEELRDQIISRLDPLERAAIFLDLKEFAYRYREQQEINELDFYLE